MDYKHTEIRKLPSDFLNVVTDILEEDQQWKEFMSIIPRNLVDLSKDVYDRKYNSEHIRMIENYVKDQKPKVNYAKVLFSEWGTSGYVRPTLASVQALLIRAEMFKAADQIATQLGEPLPPRPVGGPAAKIDFNILDTKTQSTSNDHGNETLEHCNRSTKPVESFNLIKFPDSNINNYQPAIGNSEYLPIDEVLNPPSKLQEHISNTESMSSTGTSYVTESESFIPKYIADDSFIAEEDNLIAFSFTDVKAMTNNFEISCGKGVFGDVFMGNHFQRQIAVKKAHDQYYCNHSIKDTYKMFQSEVNALSKLQHPNIIKIIGKSDDDIPCIVYEYIDNGDLKQKLIEKILTEGQRIKIMIGTANGLNHIHNFEKPSLTTPGTYQKANFIHGDVKSANILLTKDFVPKLCDFGLTEDISDRNEKFNGNGTHIYMAPECFSDKIDQKSDVYSYGIVLLEVLTGKPAVEYENGIKKYIQENAVDDITPILDKTVGQWMHSQSLFDIAMLCVNEDMTQRPTIAEILDKLPKNYN